MPISITPAQPGNSLVAGWGMAFIAQTDFVGPIPAGAVWTFSVLPATGESGIWLASRPSQVNPQSFQIGSTTDTGARGTGQVADGDDVKVLVQLLSSPGVAIDTGVIAIPWNQTSADQQSLLDHISVSTGSGLTPEEATQLDQTHASTFLSVALDAMTLQELTQGPQGGVIAAQLPSVVFGVIIRIAQVPNELTPTTPDEDYWVSSLAVVRLFRGADLWLRVPIHTSSKIIPFASQDLVVAVSELTLTDWLLNLSVQVFFREGVTGQVFLMHFP